MTNLTNESVRDLIQSISFKEKDMYDLNYNKRSICTI